MLCMVEEQYTRTQLLNYWPKLFIKLDSFVYQIWKQSFYVEQLLPAPEEGQFDYGSVQALNCIQAYHLNCSTIVIVFQ